MSTYRKPNDKKATTKPKKPKPRRGSAEAVIAALKELEGNPIKFAE